MSTTPIATTDFFPPGHKARIIEHMNDDHADAVLRYARHQGRRLTALAARLVDLDRHGLDLAITEMSGEQLIRVAFESPLEKPDDAHHTLIAMAKAARVALGERSDDDTRREAALTRAREVAEKFRLGFKTVLLGTVSSQGEPDASVAPAIVDPEGAFLTYVSTLSAHTRNLTETGRASVLLIEDEASAQHLLARKRLTFLCRATPIARDHPSFPAAMTALKEKFGPVMEHLEAMHDFQLIRLIPHRGRLVAGFGQAYEVDPLDWSKLSHLGGTGHGHTGSKAS